MAIISSKWFARNKSKGGQNEQKNEFILKFYIIFHNFHTTKQTNCKYFSISLCCIFFFGHLVMYIHEYVPKKLILCIYFSARTTTPVTSITSTTTATIWDSLSYIFRSFLSPICFMVWYYTRNFSILHLLFFLLLLLL